MKKEFLCVKPRSNEAKDRFVNDMNNLHSCRVMKREHGRIYLSSISNRYSFVMFDGADDHWEVIK